MTPTNLLPCPEMACYRSERTGDGQEVVAYALRKPQERRWSAVAALHEASTVLESVTVSALFIDPEEAVRDVLARLAMVLDAPMVPDGTLRLVK